MHYSSLANTVQQGGNSSDSVIPKRTGLVRVLWGQFELFSLMPRYWGWAGERGLHEPGWPTRGEVCADGSGHLAKKEEVRVFPIALFPVLVFSGRRSGRRGQCTRKAIPRGKCCFSFPCSC